MNKMILTILVAAVVAFGQTDNAKQAADKQASHAKVLTRAELDELLAKPGRVLIVDVRRPDEISKVGGFPVYLNVQIDDLAKELGVDSKGPADCGAFESCPPRRARG